MFRGGLRKVGEPGLAWMMGAMACPGAGCFLRQKNAQKQGVDESSFMSWCLWCMVPCFAICQEAKVLGTMDCYVAPEVQSIERDARNSK